MIFFFNANGDLLKATPETVYQGSSNASKIYIVAPIEDISQATASFILANGEMAQPVILTNNGKVEDEGVSVWYTSLDKYITQYRGDVVMQVKFYNGTEILACESVNIKISKGVVIDLPEKASDDVWDEIIQYLAYIKQTTADEVVKTINNEATARETADTQLQNNIDKKYDSENLVAGDGITFTSDGKKTTIKSNNSNLMNGTDSNLYQKTCEAFGYSGSFATGYKTVAGNYQAHAEGYQSKALGPQSHAEGNNTKTQGFYSHSEGLNTSAKGDCSHAEGNNTQANAWASHSEGNTTIAGYEYQLTIGEFNNNKSTTRFEVGNGTSDTNRKNAFEVLSDGRAKVQSAPTEDDDVVRLKELNEKALYLHSMVFSGGIYFTYISSQAHEYSKDYPLPEGFSASIMVSGVAGFGVGTIGIATRSDGSYFHWVYTSPADGTVISYKSDKRTGFYNNLADTVTRLI